MTGSSAAPAPPAPAQPRAGSHLSGRGSDNCDNWSRAAAAARWRLFLLSPINCVIYNKGGVTTDFHGVLLREYSAITPTPAPARSAAESVEEGGASAWMQWTIKCPYRMTCQNFGKANRLGYVKILILFMTKAVDIFN